MKVEPESRVPRNAYERFVWDMQRAMVAVFEAGVPPGDIGRGLAVMTGVLLHRLRPEDRARALADIMQMAEEARDDLARFLAEEDGEEPPE